MQVMSSYFLNTKLCNKMKNAYYQFAYKIYQLRQGTHIIILIAVSYLHRSSTQMLLTIKLKCEEVANLNSYMICFNEIAGFINLCCICKAFRFCIHL